MPEVYNPNGDKASEYRFKITGPINERAVNLVTGHILRAETHPKITSIRAVLTSNGGDVEAGKALYELVRNCEIPSTVLAVGYVKSAAVGVMQAFDRRLATPNTKFMTHPSTLKVVNIKDKEERRRIIDYRSELAEEWLELTVARTGLSILQLKERFTPIWYFDAEEARSLRFIDDIVEPHRFPQPVLRLVASSV